MNGPKHDQHVNGPLVIYIDLQRLTEQNDHDARFE